MAEDVVIRLDELTWGELEELERLAGPEATEALMAGNVRPSAMVPLMWITMRRADPAVTIEAVRLMPITTPIRVEGEAANPTVGGDRANGRKLSPPSATSSASDLVNSSG
jgi:hypothetical protein